MKEGWIPGALTGAVMGAGAMAVCAMMNRGTRRKMVSVVTGASRKAADKFEQMAK